MNQPSLHRPHGQLRAAGLITSFAVTVLVAACGGGGDDGPAPKAANQLYTETNETANMVVHFVRQADGTLVRKESTATGGAGVNAVGTAGTTVPDSLASQHAVVISPDGTTLFAVNAGDSTISVFSIDQSSGALTLKKKSAAGAGQRPNSLAYNKGVLYATYQQGTTQLAAYTVATDGSLSQLGAYNLATLGGLPAASVAPTQLIASPDGAFIVVSAGAPSNAVMSFGVNADGMLKSPVTTTASIATPFAGAFQPGAATPTYLTTGIAADSLSAFSFSATGALALVGQASAAGTAAPCWLVLTPNGSSAFVGNGSGSISAYSVASTGAVTLLNSTAAIEPGAITGVNSVAADSWISPDGKFLYSAFLGDDKVVAYSIGQNGSLAKLGETVIGTATHLSLQGLVGI